MEKMRGLGSCTATPPVSFDQRDRLNSDLNVGVLPSRRRLSSRRPQSGVSGKRHAVRDPP